MSCCSDLKRDIFPNAADCFSDGTVVEENKRKFTIKWTRKGERTLCKIKVDGCLIADHTVSKCDFAFYICPEKHFLFVELKGTDILKAIEQILVTIRHFRAKTTISKDSIRAFVISSAVPSGSNQKVRDAISLFKRDTGRDLIVKNSQCVYEIP